MERLASADDRLSRGGPQNKPLVLRLDALGGGPARSVLIMRRGGGRDVERDECITDACGAAVAAGRSTSSADRRTNASPSRASASPSRASASSSRAAASPSWRSGGASHRVPPRLRAPAAEPRHFNDTDLLCAICAKSLLVFCNAPI
jgi:hypothetical protein